MSITDYLLEHSFLNCLHSSHSECPSGNIQALNCPFTSFVSKNPPSVKQLRDAGFSIPVFVAGFNNTKLKTIAITTTNYI